MLQEAMTLHRPPPAGAQAVRDYDQIQRAVAFLAGCWAEQPGLEELAAHLGLEPTQCQKLFKRWCGLSPKEFVQALTVHHARSLLKDSASVLEAAYEVGLSGGGRLHDLFVAHEAMTPGEYKRRGEGLEMAYGFHPSPFGEALLFATPRGLAGLAFVDEDKGKTPEDTLAEMMLRWPKARFMAAPDRTAPFARLVFNPADWSRDRPVRLVLIGSDFEVRVWETLLRIPVGRAVSYGDIACHLGRPTAARAVGAAVGRNPVSFVVPCHRVLGRDGSLTGYHWGVTRKRALIGWEAGRVAGRL
jgi:AraC family transcriptional regulator of adaptative response/methylated-DNA-[protein]-cysteine methyltransferase